MPCTVGIVGMYLGSGAIGRIDRNVLNQNT